MVERIVNCLQNDYDVFIVVGIAFLAGLFMIIYHKYEEKQVLDKSHPSIINMKSHGMMTIKIKRV